MTSLIRMLDVNACKGMPILSSKDLQSHDMQVHAVSSDLSTFAPPAVHLLLEMCQSLAAEMMFDQLLFKCGLRTMLECTQSRCVTTSCNQGAACCMLHVSSRAGNVDRFRPEELLSDIVLTGHPAEGSR